MRDFEKSPYTPDEERVARWLDNKAGIGGGDDPIGFLLASYELLKMEVKTLSALRVAISEAKEVEK